MLVKEHIRWCVFLQLYYLIYLMLLFAMIDYWAMVVDV